MNEYVTFDIKKPILGFVLPDDSDQSIIENIIHNDIFNNTQIEYIQFKTQDEMIKYNTNINNKEQLFCGIIFENKDLLKYTIRLDIKNTENPETSPIQNIAENNSLLDITSSYLDLYIPIQTAVDEAIIRMKSDDNSFKMKYFIGKLRGIFSNVSPDSVVLSSLTTYYISLAFMTSVYIITINIVKEKEDNLKDGLLVAGVHPTIFWLSWFIVEGFISLIISMVMTIIIIILNELFSNVNFVVIFSIIFLFSLSACSYGFVFSTFFKKAKTASVVVLILYIIPYFIAQYTSFMNENISKILSFIFSTVSLKEILNNLEILKYTYKSINLINIFNTDAGKYLIILTGNTIFYFILALILDNLFSNETSRYLFVPKRRIKNFQSENEINYQKDIQEDFNARNNKKCMVEVNHVHKIFNKRNKSNNDSSNRETKVTQKKNEFLAVNDVSFKVYQNEIFAILGI